MRYFLFLFSIFVFALYACDENSSDNDNNDTKEEEVVPGDSITINIRTEFDDDTLRIIEFSRLPHSYLRFSEVQQAIGETPEGAAALFILALHVYREYESEGEKCLADACHMSLKAWDVTNNRPVLLKYHMDGVISAVAKYSRLEYAYMNGATPENNYTPDEPYGITVNYDANNSNLESGTVRLYVHTKGADSNRPMTIKREEADGFWRITEFSSLFTGLK